MLSLLLAVLILGVVAFVIRAMPIDAPFKTVAYAICVIVLLILIANAFGVGPHLSLK